MSTYDVWVEIEKQADRGYYEKDGDPHHAGVFDTREEAEAHKAKLVDLEEDSPSMKLAVEQSVSEIKALLALSEGEEYLDTGLALDTFNKILDQLKPHIEPQEGATNG